MTNIDAKPQALVIDDDAFGQRFLATILTSEGYEVVCCSSALDALAVCDDASQTFDLIFVDVMMPEMDGVELIRRLREQASTRETAIICVSAGDNGDYFDAMEAGADEFLRKPYCRYDLQRAVALIRKRSSDANAARGRYVQWLPTANVPQPPSIAG